MSDFDRRQRLCADPFRRPAPAWPLAVREGGLAPAPTARIRAGSGLVVVQIALAFVLLAGAALLVRSFVRVIAVDPGFRADHLRDHARVPGTARVSDG